jgi:diguanylate cyclase (GGDEF)-like protein/PAS domain S-box-containing protein
MTNERSSDRGGNLAKPAGTPLRALIVEDSESDAALLLHALRGAGYAPTFERVQGANAMRAALQSQKWDIVFSDHDMPGFNSLGALEEVQRTGEDIPFIILSGGIADQTAVDAMRRGAHDYVIKGNQSRLLPAVARELKEALIRHEHRNALHLLREHEEQFRQLAENIQEVFFLTDPQGSRILYVSPAYEEVWGRSCQSLCDRPQSWAESVHPEDRERVAGAAEVFKVAERFDDQYRIVRADGSVRWVHVRGFPIQDGSGNTIRVAGIANDITAQKDQQERIDRLTRIHAVLSGINAAIVRVHDRTQLFREACRILVEQGRLRMAWIGLTDPDTQQMKPIAWMGVENGYLSEVASTLRNVTEDGCIGGALRDKKAVIVNEVESDPKVVYKREALARDYRSLAVFPLLAGGEAVGVLALYAMQPGFFDQEETKLLAGLAADIAFALQSMAKEERLSYLAHYDVLTGLPNRALFVERLGEKIRSKQRDTKAMAVLVVEAERFSTINNTLGRQVGDSLLKLIAGRLTHSLQDMGAVARVGEACFAIAIPDLRAEGDAVHVCEKLNNDLATPFVVDGDDLRISVRCGIAVFPADGDNAATLLESAETAVKKAEDAREKYVFYAPEMQARTAKRLTLEKKLHTAIDNEEFVLYYQPKIALDNGRVTGVEALIRWQDPGHGLVLPNDFIPLLEETGMIMDVGRWALEKAGSDYRRWLAQGLQAPRVAVNVSPIQLRQKDFVEQVRRAAQIRHGGPVFLDLEITESVVMEDVQRNIETLKALRNIGVGIAIDDFGTGYSSLSYVVKLPVNALKIDRAFIADMAKSSESMLIVSSVIYLAHSLNLTVVAEGVETAEQLHFLQSLKCDEMQGHLISRPVPANEIEAMLRHGLKSVATHWPAYAEMGKELA